jgi:hypothetical protein
MMIFNIFLQALSRDVYHLELQKEKSDFVDLGSSSQAGKNANGEDEQLVFNKFQTNEYQPDRFEDQWFSFFSSIKDGDL